VGKATACGCCLLKTIAHSAFVAKGLREQAYAVLTANATMRCMKRRSTLYDLVILDVMIPGRNGFEVCRELRRADSACPS